jgi:hypothetical protein
LLIGSIGLGFFAGAPPASAAQIESLSDPSLQKLSERDGEYSVRFLGVDTSQFRNGAGGILGISAEVTFHLAGNNSILPDLADGGTGAGAASDERHALLVFTSVRLGAKPAGGLRCVAGGQLPLADVDFVSDSFSGPTTVDEMIVGDAPGGKVCDAEGDRFVAVELSGASGQTQRVDFDIRLNSTQPSLAFFFQYQAYSVTPVPEPATAALIGGGLAGFAAWRRKRALA